MLNIFKITSAILLAVVVMLSIALVRSSGDNCVNDTADRIESHISKLKAAVENKREEKSGLLKKIRDVFKSDGEK